MRASASAMFRACLATFACGAFAVALLPAAALAQVEPVSGPVSADDLTPYAGTYTIVAPAAWRRPTTWRCWRDSSGPTATQSVASVRGTSLRPSSTGSIRTPPTTRLSTTGMATAGWSAHRRQRRRASPTVCSCSSRRGWEPGEHSGQLAGDAGGEPSDLGGAERGGEPGLHPLARGSRA